MKRYAHGKEERKVLNIRKVYVMHIINRIIIIIN